MTQNVQIIFGGSDKTNGDFSRLREIAQRNGMHRWACGKETKTGDTLLMYFNHPHSAIIAVATALQDAKPGDHWRYVTRIGRVRFLPSEITLAELRKMFPRWLWLNYPRSNQYLDDSKASRLLARAGLKLNTPPVSVRVSGGGFGTPEQNRLVERAACRAVKAYFTKRRYKIVSRERDRCGYDFDVSRDGEVLHVEVKGVSGAGLQFPITANEVGCARSDSAFQLAIVTEARTRKRHIDCFTGKQFLKRFKLHPLAFRAEQNE